MTEVVDSVGKARSIATALWFETGPFGVDTETTGCNPARESPVGRARVWCLTVALRKATAVHRVFVPRRYLEVFGDWLEDPTYRKVGGGLWDYDRHALANEGIALRGIAGDTIRMSRLLDPSQTAGHGVKDWAARLGYEVRPYSAVARRQKPGALRTYKQDRVVRGDWPVVYAAGAECQNVSWSQTEDVPLPQLWEEYPQRRKALVEYASLDAELHLVIYEHLREKLKGVSW